MRPLESFVEQKLADGAGFFTSEEVRGVLGLSEAALAAAALRLIKKTKLAHPRRGFYLILRPEDRSAGAPDPAQWIGPLLQHQSLDYRVSLFRAAAWHGASHQAAMVFQIVVPRQLRDLNLGRHRLEFLFQTKQVFSAANQPEFEMGGCSPTRRSIRLNTELAKKLACAQASFAALAQMTAVTHETDVAEAVWLAANDESGTLRFPAGADAVALAQAK